MSTLSMSTFSVSNIKDQARMSNAPATSRLLWAAFRMKYHRRWGPGHEINFAIDDLDDALEELGCSIEVGCRAHTLQRILEAAGR